MLTGSNQETLPLNSDQEKILVLQKQLAKKEKINQALMKRIENEFSPHNPFSLFQTASSVELEVKERTLSYEKTVRELNQANQQLEKALSELAESQSRLVLSEKMAALGQLVSGIAHEVNTPLGVIMSSIGAVTISLEEITTFQMRKLRAFSEDAFNFFLSLLERSNPDVLSKTSKELRTLRKSLASDLNLIGVKDADEVADTLVDAGLYENLQDLYHQLQNQECIEALGIAVSYISLRQNQLHIDLAIGKASKVVFALKEFAHHDNSGEMVKTNINENIDTVLALYSNSLKQGILVTKRFGQIPPVLCYPDEICQIWTNLIFNAIQAMGNDGELSIETGPKGQGVVVKVIDNGHGIPLDIQDKIFDSFFTTKPAGEGTGLGLSIIKNIIEKHKGSISVESKSGRTVFEVVLPII